MIVRDLIKHLLDQDLDAEARIDLPAPLHTGLEIRCVERAGYVSQRRSASIVPTDEAMKRLMDRIQYLEQVYHHGLEDS
jgi:hypothetical protein